MERTRDSRSKTTVADVARAAGVSAMSVSLAFRNSPRVSEKTRRKILNAARNLHYIPNLSARQLRSGQTDMIGFLVQDISNPFHSLMMKHAEAMFAEQNMNMVFGGSGWDPVRELQFAERLIRMRVRGILICPTEKNPQLFSLLDDAEIPYVVLDSAPEDFPGCAVLNDLTECGRLAARHLAERGARRIAYLDAGQERRTHSVFTRITEGFQTELAKQGLPFERSWQIPAGLTMQAGAEVCRQLCGQPDFPDAVFCVNDLCALGFMNEAERHGLSAGKDFALAGIDDMDFSSMERISLTTIRQPYEELARHAVAVLNTLMDGGTPLPRRIMLKQQLIIRNTTLHYNP